MNFTTELAGWGYGKEENQKNLGGNFLRVLGQILESSFDPLSDLDEINP